MIGFSWVSLWRRKGLVFLGAFSFSFCFLGFQTLHRGDEAFSMDFPFDFLSFSF